MIKFSVFKNSAKENVFNLEVARFDQSVGSDAQI